MNIQFYFERLFLSEEYEKFKKEFKKINSYEKAERLYMNMLDETYKQYKRFLENVKEYKKGVNLPEKELNKIEKDLKKYFEYKEYQRAQSEYASMMYENFGHYIEPERWCYLSRCPDRATIKKVIRQETQKKWNKNFSFLPPKYISYDEFRNNPEIKKKLLKSLESKGIILPKNYNYSKQVFINAYKQKLKRTVQNLKKEIDDKYYSRLGIHVKPGMTYKEFVIQLKPRLKRDYGKYSDVLLGFLLNKSDSGFFEKFYVPYFQEEKMKEFLPDKKEFYTDKKYIKLGNESVKMLFIPPFAIIVSLLAGVLNLISLISLLLTLPLNKIASKKRVLIIKLSLKILLLTAFTLLPLYYGKKHNIIKPYEKVFQKINGKYVKSYKEILIWTIVLEKINYEHIYPHVKTIINKVPETFSKRLKLLIYKIVFEKKIKI